MKSIAHLLLFTFCLFVTQNLSATVCLHAAVPLSTTAEIQLKNFSAKDYQVLVGKKLSLREKIVFHFAKKDLMQTKAVVDRTTLEQKVSSYGSDFNLGGFLLGFILNIVGVLIALLFGGDVLKWAWKGFWISVLVWLIGILIGRK